MTLNPIQSNTLSPNPPNNLVPDKLTCSLIGDSLFKFLGISGKEVIFEQDTDAQQQVGVYGFLIENLVDVRAAISQFAGKPRDGFVLGFQLLFDEAANVHSVLGVCHRFPDWRY